MKDSRLTEEQMVTILSEVDKAPVAEVVKLRGMSEQINRYEVIGWFCTNSQRLHLPWSACRNARSRKRSIAANLI